MLDALPLMQLEGWFDFVQVQVLRIQASFDDIDRNYAPGELISGHITVKPQRDLRVSRFMLMLAWNSEGKAEFWEENLKPHQEMCRSLTWYKGQFYSYPIHLRIPDSFHAYSSSNVQINTFLKVFVKLYAQSRKEVKALKRNYAAYSSPLKVQDDNAFSFRWPISIGLKRGRFFVNPRQDRFEKKFQYWVPVGLLAVLGASFLLPYEELFRQYNPLNVLFIPGLVLFAGLGVASYQSLQSFYGMGRLGKVRLLADNLSASHFLIRIQAQRNLGSVRRIEYRYLVQERVESRDRFGSFANDERENLVDDAVTYLSDLYELPWDSVEGPFADEVKLTLPFPSTTVPPTLLLPAIRTRWLVELVFHFNNAPKYRRRMRIQVSYRSEDFESKPGLVSARHVTNAKRQP